MRCAAGLVVFLLLKGHPRVAALLLAVLGVTAVVALFDLAARAQVVVLGSLPQGLPVCAISWLDVVDIEPVLNGGLAVALVFIADTSVLWRTYAARSRSRVDSNQEMVGLGAANLAAGLFSSIVCTTWLTTKPPRPRPGDPTP